MAEMIICQERYQQRDAEGVVNDEWIDLQAFSRSGGVEVGILMSFAADYGDGTHEYKYRRNLDIKLSGLAQSALAHLQGKGPWPSRYAVMREMDWKPGGKQYRAVAELIVKGYLADKPDFHLVGDPQDALKEASGNPVATMSAREFLERHLMFNGQPLSDGLPVTAIKQMAPLYGVNFESLKTVRQRLGIVSYDDKDGLPWWKLTVAPKKERRKAGVIDFDAQAPQAQTA
jgi:hypothetical protein